MTAISLMKMSTQAMWHRAWTLPGEKTSWTCKYGDRHAMGFPSGERGATSAWLETPVPPPG